MSAMRRHPLATGPLPPAGKQVAWHCLSAEEALQQLHSSPQGLSTHEIARRLAHHGPNELRETKPIRPWYLFLAQFRSLLVGILIVAALVSGLLGEWIDGIAILAIVFLNAIIGFYQEYSAERSIAALKRMTAPMAKVHRDGKTLLVPAAAVVVGDVLELEAGDLIAADARLLSAAALACVEAPLTGEAEAVPKQPEVLEEAELPLGDRRNLLYMGTTVVAGTARAVVVATGMATEMGKIAGLLQTAAEDRTPLQHRLEAFGQRLVWATLAIVCLVFAIGLLRALPPFELFLTSVSLAVAAVPEGLPAVVTVALAIGVQRMARRKALIRKLPAVETLGCSSVVCTDKTGTLTKGEMTVRALYAAGHSWTVTGEGYGPEGEIQPATPGQSDEVLRWLLTILADCNNASLVQEDEQWKVIGDPTEGALLSAGLKFGLSRELLDSTWKRIHENPFDSDRKRMSVVVQGPDGKRYLLVKGAPDLLLPDCAQVLTPEGLQPLTDTARAAIAGVNGDMAGQGQRVLGAAYREIGDSLSNALTKENELVFVGLAGMIDPPRPEAKEAISRCHSAGIRVVMITGDHPRTALAIARELGLVTKDEGVLSGSELDALSDAQLCERVSGIAVYARVSAEHKLRIIRAWKANGHVVAMTGDGVNDAPAIKGADVGIAMGRSGTDVTKGASDMVIADDNFASIVAAIEEGRGVYANIRKTIQYLLAGNVGEILLVTGSMLMAYPIPLLPIHLLWINLVTDGLPAIALATDPLDRDLLRQPPRRDDESFTDKRFVLTTLLMGFLMASVSFAVYRYALMFEPEGVARTWAFATLVYAQLWWAFGARNERKPLWQIDLFANGRLAAVVFGSLLLQPWMNQNTAINAFFKTTPLPMESFLLLMAIASLPLLLQEVFKRLLQYRQGAR